MIWTYIILLFEFITFYYFCPCVRMCVRVFNQFTLHLLSFLLFVCLSSFCFLSSYFSSSVVFFHFPITSISESVMEGKSKTKQKDTAAAISKTDKMTGYVITWLYPPEISLLLSRGDDNGNTLKVLGSSHPWLQTCTPVIVHGVCQWPTIRESGTFSVSFSCTSVL